MLIIRVLNPRIHRAHPGEFALAKEMAEKDKAANHNDEAWDRRLLRAFIGGWNLTHQCLSSGFCHQGRWLANRMCDTAPPRHVCQVENNIILNVAKRVDDAESIGLLRWGLIFASRNRHSIESFARVRGLCIVEYYYYPRGVGPHTHLGPVHQIR